MKRRDELEGVEKAVATVLDDWLVRCHGIIASHANQDLFIDLLREEGYVITEQVDERCSAETVPLRQITEDRNLNPVTCCLPADHSGWHKSNCGIEWGVLGEEAG